MFFWIHPDVTTFLTNWYTLHDVIPFNFHLGVKSEVRDGSDSQIIVINSVSEKSSDVTPRSAGRYTDNDLLRNSDNDKGDIYSELVVKKETDKGKSEKKIAVNKGKSEKKVPVNDGKSEKRVPHLAKTECTERAKVSKPYITR